MSDSHRGIWAHWNETKKLCRKKVTMKPMRNLSSKKEVLEKESFRSERKINEIIHLAEVMSKVCVNCTHRMRYGRNGWYFWCCRVESSTQFALTRVVLGVGHRRIGVGPLGLGLTCQHQSVEVKFISVPLAVNFCHYVLVVVVPVKIKVFSGFVLLSPLIVVLSN